VKNVDTSEQAVIDAPTRIRVAESILAHGPSTAAALGLRLDLTPAGIRRHLDHLVEAGHVEAREERVYGQRRRGRPAKVFALTDAGRGEFAHAYDDLATQAIQYLHSQGGDEAVKAFARHRLADLEATYRAELADAPDKSAKLAELLSRDGFAASVESTPLGEQKGVIFTDTDSALRDHPELFREYFGTIIPPGDNKFAALNSAVWSGGSFIYVPKGVKIEFPLQAYFRINSQNMGQFERTLIIVDEGASIHYVEGCTAPTYSSNSLHSAVVEIVVKQRSMSLYDDPELVEQRL
jgi:predicted ArsR family transcriptional regulator